MRHEAEAVELVVEAVSEAATRMVSRVLRRRIYGNVADGLVEVLSVVLAVKERLVGSSDLLAEHHVPVHVREEWVLLDFRGPLLES